MISVSQLFIYPIKSMKGIALNQAITADGGFQHDRILMISEPDGTFITARQYPELLKLKTSVTNNEVQVSLPSMEPISICLDGFTNTTEPTEVWGNHFLSHIASIKVNQFFSQFLQRDVQLRWVGNKLTRRTKRYPEVPVSFADGYPYLLLNEASFVYLQQQCPEKLDIGQFRGNIIINGALPYAEDGWKTIKIGEVIFDIVKPCSRCVVTTININSTQYLQGNEPIKTLASFRTDENGEIDFGVNMIARNYGKVSVNDPIEVLERQTAKKYIKFFSSNNNHRNQIYTITFEGKSINGNNQQTILEQLEQHNLYLPYSCRAGVCGRCKIILKQGKVTAMTQDAVRSNNQILACSCIPKTNIVIELPKK